MSGNVRLSDEIVKFLNRDDDMERAQFVGLKKAFALLEHEHARLNQRLNDQRRKDRLLLAGLAMAGYLANGYAGSFGPSQMAAQSVARADALLAELEARDD